MDKKEVYFLEKGIFESLIYIPRRHAKFLNRSAAHRFDIQLHFKTKSFEIGQREVLAFTLKRFYRKSRKFFSF